MADKRYNSWQAGNEKEMEKIHYVHVRNKKKLKYK
jgi:hypothetical protein